MICVAICKKPVGCRKMQNWVLGLILKLTVSSFQNCLNFVSMTFTSKVIIKWCWVVLYYYLLISYYFKPFLKMSFGDIRWVFPDRITYLAWGFKGVHTPFGVWYDLQGYYTILKKIKNLNFPFLQWNAFANIIILNFLLVRRDVWFKNQSC